MCGIVAHYGEINEEAAWRMLRRMAHRGPDDENSVRVGDCWLGHRRLSIVDPSGGRQPLSTKAGGLWIVGNGEIYNHVSIRPALGEERFATNSDNEVALHLVDTRGPKAIADMRGMFAFVAAGDDGTVVAARDPVGIKPLYWARRNGAVRFASELRSFDPDWRPDVEFFPPGHFWTPQTGLVRYASATPRTDVHLAVTVDEVDASVDRPPPSVLARLREVLTSAVEREMMSDVPVGAFLSGGLDSSLVAAIAARYCRRLGKRLHTFSVGTPDSPDLAAARVVAEYLGTDHHESVYTTEKAVESLPEVLRVLESFDPALVRSAVPNYKLAELAASHVKVVLTGEGADEVFAGYDYLQSFRDETSLHAELTRTVNQLHALNLQRCDRVTMAHGLEARVPFLDLDVIAFGLSLPASWKLAGEGRAEKHLLRAAFAGWLPDHILWRKKLQFGDGAGTSGVLQHRAEASVSEAEFSRERASVEPPLRTREEVAYYREFRSNLRGIRPERTIERSAMA